MPASGVPAVVDAGAVLKLVLPERYSHKASKLRDDHPAEGVTAHALDSVLL